MSQQINLFNPIFLNQKKQFSAWTMAEALGLLLAGVIAFYGYVSFGTGDLVKQADETARQYNQSRERLAQATARYGPKKADTGLEAQVNDLQAQVNARQTMLSGLGNDVLTGDTGYAEYLRVLARQSLAGLWLTGFKVGRGGAEMEIVGRALQPELVPSYIRRLNQERAMQGRAFDELSMTQRQGALPAGAPAAYSYIEFRLGSNRVELAPPGALAQGSPQRAQNPAGSPK
jgi:hypothetical protein